jgi:hypothetical protein
MHNTSITISAGLAVVAMSAAAFGQSFTIVAQEGETVPNIGDITRLDGVYVNNFGQWLVEADTSNSDTDADSVVLGNLGLFQREGQPIDGGTTFLLDGFDDFDLDNAGNLAQNLFIDGTLNGNDDDSGIYYNGMLLIQEDSGIAAAGIPTGSATAAGFFGVKTNDSGSILGRISLDEPGGSSILSSLITFDSNGSNAQVLAIEGDTLPGLGGELLNDIESSPDEWDYNNSGQALFGIDIDSDTSTDGAIYLTGVGLLAREGSASPVAGLNYDGLGSSELALGDGGDYVFNAGIDTGSNVDDSIVVYNGNVIAREGDLAPGFTDRFYDSLTISTFDIDASGNVLWSVGLSGDTDTDEVIYLNDQVLIQEGVSVIDGLLVTGISQSEQTLQLSDDGSWAIVELVVEDKDGNSADAAVLILIPEPATVGLLAMAAPLFLRRRRRA